MILYSILELLDLKTCLVCTVLVIILAELIRSRIPSSFPPGPWAPPIVGHIYMPYNYETLNKLAEDYGTVYSLKYATKKEIFVHGYKMVKEALVNQLESFADRPSVPVFAPFFKQIGVTMSNGHLWKMHKKFTHSHLRHFGGGKKILEQFVQQECVLLCEAFKEETGPFDPYELLRCAIGNIVMSVVVGHRFDYKDEQFLKMLHYDSSALRMSGAPLSLLYNSFPWFFKYVPGDHQTVFTFYTRLLEFLEVEIKKHQETLDPANPRDFIDSYLAEVSKTEKGENDPEAGFNMETLLVSTLDLLEAGTEGGKAAMYWIVLFMMKYPDIQRKVQDEIDRVIGQSRLPTSEDRPKMPYTEAVIQESLRMGVPIPFGVAKMATKDTTLGEYFIPKGSVLNADLSSVLKDKDEWETPNTFNPEHFIDKDGNLRKREAFFPFSLGKRSCVGEPLARMELFLFLTTLLQRFTFAPVPGVELSLESNLGFCTLPNHYQLRALPR